MHGGQRDRRGGRRGTVVEADHGDVAGHRSTALAQHGEHAGGHDVARDEDAVEVGDAVEQAPGGGDGAGRREVGGLDRVGGQVGRAHGATVALEAIDARGHVERSGHRTDAVPPHVDEVLRADRAALDVVDVDEDVVARLRRTAAVDEREQHAGLVLQVVPLVVRDDEGPVDHAGAQVPHGLVTGIGRRDEQVQQVVAVVEPTGDALHDRREVGVSEEERRVLGDDQRDRARGAAGQRPGGPVRHVVQLGDRGVHRGHHVGADLRRAVHDSAHGRARHVRLTRDLLERRRRVSHPDTTTPLHIVSLFPCRRER